MDNLDLCCSHYPQFFKMSKNNVLQFDNFLDDELIEVVTLLNQYNNLALSLFKWETPPEYQGINSDLIEKLLLFSGRCALIKRENTGYDIVDFLAEKNTNFNFLGHPEKIQPLNPYTRQPEGEKISKENFVIIPNNEFWLPTIFDIWKYCRRLIMCDNAIESNLKKQKFPILFQGDEKQKISMSNLAQQIDSNFNYIFVNKEYNLDSVTSLDIAGEYRVNEIYQSKKEILNELLTFLGINNENVNKMSGVTDDEVNANNGVVLQNILTRFTPRKKAVEEIKNKFNLDLKITIDRGVVNESIYAEFERYY